MERKRELKARQLGSILRRLGCVLRRHKGAHQQWYTPDGQLIVIPCHVPGRDVQPRIVKHASLKLRREGIDLWSEA